MLREGIEKRNEEHGNDNKDNKRIESTDAKNSCLY
jgi:hypothetical protein